MNTHKIIKFASVGFAIAGLATIVGGGSTYAATKTWVGDGANDNFSTVANWSDGTAPVSGDTLVFNKISGTGKRTQPLNDIAGLSVSGMTISCTGEGVIINPHATQAITLTGNVTGEGCSSSVGLSGLYILGADISVTNLIFGGSNVISPTHGLNLNDRALTVSAPDDTFNIFSNFVISGNGIVNYENSGYIRSQNTYTGTTNINVASGNTMLSVDAEFLAGFGSSTININRGKVIFELGIYEFEANGNIDGKTYANQINVKNTMTNYYSLSFDCSSSYCTGNEVLNVPNLNLLSNIGIDTNNVKINLAGMKTNGFCMEYWETGAIVTSGAPSMFLNAPAACAVDDNSNPPGVPNTSGFFTNSPLAVFSIGVGITAAVYFLMRQKKSA